jgi:hypothetical protein
MHEDTQHIRELTCQELSYLLRWAADRPAVRELRDPAAAADAAMAAILEAGDVVGIEGFYRQLMAAALRTVVRRRSRAVAEANALLGRARLELAAVDDWYDGLADDDLADILRRGCRDCGGRIGDPIEVAEGRCYDCEQRVPRG